MTTKQAAELYRRSGHEVPKFLEQQSFEKVVNTKRKSIDSIVFRSTLEAEVYRLLKLWQMAGRISGLECQPKFLLQPKYRDPYTGRMHREITYTADFRFVRDGQVYAIDAKGYRMEVFRIKWKMAVAKYPEVRFEQWTRETLNNLL